MTNEEKQVVEGLRYCGVMARCDECPMFGRCDPSEKETYVGDIAASLIEQVTQERDANNEKGYRFYYCESEDEYLLGHRFGNMYYAHWRNGSFCWDMSRYLPWGETVDGHERGCAWGLHTFPSEPKEIGAYEWFQGFMEQRLREGQTKD